MGTIVISGPQNVSLDGVVQDPDGEEGFRLGGWFVQFGGKDLEEWNKVAPPRVRSRSARSPRPHGTARCQAPHDTPKPVATPGQARPGAAMLQIDPSYLLTRSTCGR